MAKVRWLLTGFIGLPREQNRWGFPRGVAVHYSTGGRSGSSTLWSTTGLKPRDRYNLMALAKVCSFTYYLFRIAPYEMALKVKG